MPKRPIEIRISEEERIVLTPLASGKGASIDSSLARGEDTPAFNGACDGIESLVLALYSTGAVDFADPAIQRAVKLACEKVADELGEE